MSDNDPFNEIPAAEFEEMPRKVRSKALKEKKAAKKGGKKVVRGLKEALKTEATLTDEGGVKLVTEERGTLNVEPYADPIQSDDVGAPAYDTQQAYEKAVIADFWPERKPDFAERVANAAVVTWNGFVRRLPRLVWVDDRINVNIRLTPEGQVGVFYHSKFNPKAA